MKNVFVVNTSEININKFSKLMYDIAFIYERFISISIRGEFNINSESFKGIKICLKPNFWPHSFNFKKVDYKKKCKYIKPNPLGKKWNNSLNWINKKLDNFELTIQEKKDIFVDWVKTNNELWNKTRSIWKIKDYYNVKSNAWNTLVLFLNKYNEEKSNIISDKRIFKIYRNSNGRNNLNYNSDYVLVIDDLYNVSSKKNYILIFCVISETNDLNIKLINNPTKYKDKINYLYLTLKSIQIRNKFDFSKSEELSYTNIFLNKKYK